CEARSNQSGADTPPRVAAGRKCKPYAPALRRAAQMSLGVGIVDSARPGEYPTPRLELSKGRARGDQQRFSGLPRERSVMSPCFNCGTSPERIAPESLTPLLSEFVHGHIWWQGRRAPQNRVNGD